MLTHSTYVLCTSAHGKLDVALDYPSKASTCSGTCHPGVRKFMQLCLIQHIVHSKHPCDVLYCGSGWLMVANGTALLDMVSNHWLAEGLPTTRRASSGQDGKTQFSDFGCPRHFRPVTVHCRRSLFRRTRLPVPPLRRLDGAGQLPLSSTCVVKNARSPNYRGVDRGINGKILCCRGSLAQAADSLAQPRTKLE